MCVGVYAQVSRGLPARTRFLTGRRICATVRECITEALNVYALEEVCLYSLASVCFLACGSYLNAVWLSAVQFGLVLRIVRVPATSPTCAKAS